MVWTIDSLECLNVHFIKELFGGNCLRQTECCIVWGFECFEGKNYNLEIDYWENVFIVVSFDLEMNLSRSPRLVYGSDSSKIFEINAVDISLVLSGNIPLNIFCQNIWNLSVATHIFDPSMQKKNKKNKTIQKTHLFWNCYHKYDVSQDMIKVIS